MKGALAFLGGFALIVVMATVPGSRAAYSGTTDNISNDFTASDLFSPVRVTSYQVLDGAFTGTTYTLTLENDLEFDYFVVMRGASGNGTNGGNRSPNSNYARVSGDPHGNFGVVTASNALRLERRASADDWEGQVIVIEAMRDTAGSSFQLLDVVETTMGVGVTTVTSTSGTSWSDINQVGLYGGTYGGGVDATATIRQDHQVGWAQIWPTNANEVNLRRQAGGGGSLSGTSRFTTYVVEWGSDWTIQRATVSGNNAGPGADQVGEYDTAAITPVARANTFVLAYGRSADNGLGDGFAGAIWTLGNGVTQNAVESTVAVGAEAVDNRAATVYVHTHPDLAVDYRFGTDNGTGIQTGAVSGTVTVDAALQTESYDSTGPILTTETSRLVIVSNTSNGVGNAYPRPFVWARPTGSTEITWTRSRTGQPGAIWVQSIDFADLRP